MRRQASIASIECIASAQSACGLPDNGISGLMMIMGWSSMRLFCIGAVQLFWSQLAARRLDTDARCPSSPKRLLCCIIKQHADSLDAALLSNM